VTGSWDLAGAGEQNEGKRLSVKLTVERLPESHVLLDIAAEDEEFSTAMDKAVRKVSREIQVPGFRKGKAPRHIVERMYGREIFLEETHRGLMDDLYRKALAEAEVVPVGDPEVEFVTAEPLEFKVTIAVYPTIDPGDYASVRVEPRDAAIEESQVDEVVERLRKNVSPWVEVTDARKPAEGDQVTVDLTLTGEDGEPFQDPIEDAVFVIGESQLFEPLCAAIEDLDVGGSTDVAMAFDDDDEAAAERLRGKAITYGVTLKSLKQRDLLPLDDEFAKAHAEEESLEALRTAIRTDIHQSRTNEARNDVVNEIIEAISNGATIEIPAPMIDEAVTTEIGRMQQRLQYQRTTLESYLRTTGQTEDELREELRPAVAQRLRNSLVLREVAEREGIEVSDEDLDHEVEELTEGAPNAEQLRTVYSGDRYMRTVLRNDLFDRRLTDRLIEIATEDRGAVTNGYVAPPRDELAASSEDDDSTESSVSEDDAEDAPVDAGMDNEESVSES
jgi:trigger factor